VAATGTLINVHVVMILRVRGCWGFGKNSKKFGKNFGKILSKKIEKIKKFEKSKNGFYCVAVPLAALGALARACWRGVALMSVLSGWSSSSDLSGSSHLSVLSVSSEKNFLSGKLFWAREKPDRPRKNSEVGRARA
jgi:cytochrome b